MNVLDSLHQLTHNRNLVFGPGNYEQEFIGCLCHCLLQLSEDIESSQNKKRTTWHVETPTATAAAGGTTDGGGGVEGGSAPQVRTTRNVFFLRDGFVVIGVVQIVSDCMYNCIFILTMYRPYV